MIQSLFLCFWLAIVVKFLNANIWCCPTCDNLPVISHDKFRQFFFTWIKWRLWQNFIIVHCRTLSTVKLVARKPRLYKYACRQSFGNICGQSIRNKFYCFENFKAEFLSVRQGSTRYKNVRYKSFVEVCRALHLIQAKKIQNCRTL